MEHIWTMPMHKILQNHLLCTFVANLKIGTIYALYPESFCDKNLAIRKVFAFCDPVDPIIQSLCSNISFHSTRSPQYLQEKRILLEPTKMQGKVTKALRVLKVKHILWLTKVHIVVSYDGELLGATTCLYWRL